MHSCECRFNKLNFETDGNLRNYETALSDGENCYLINSIEENRVILDSELTKPHQIYISVEEQFAFFNLLENDLIASFLDFDKCMVLADKYLLAMVLAYFKRAGFHLVEYNTINFFTALHLAHDMEEDNDYWKYELYPWALGNGYKKLYLAFLNLRDRLWKRIGYRAVVSKALCSELMSLWPYSNHWAWSRTRIAEHGGADLNNSCPDVLKLICGLNRSPHPCRLNAVCSNSYSEYVKKKDGFVLIHRVLQNNAESSSESELDQNVVNFDSP